MPDRDTIALQRRKQRLDDKFDRILSRQIGIKYIVKMLMREDRKLLKQFKETLEELKAVKKELEEKNQNAG